MCLDRAISPGMLIANRTCHHGTVDPHQPAHLSSKRPPVEGSIRLPAPYPQRSPPGSSLIRCLITYKSNSPSTPEFNGEKVHGNETTISGQRTDRLGDGRTLQQSRALCGPLLASLLQMCFARGAACQVTVMSATPLGPGSELFGQSRRRKRTRCRRRPAAHWRPFV